MKKKQNRIEDIGMYSWIRWFHNCYQLGRVFVW